ncbi:MAG TPA: DegT/DnrJ/EryC1/StrS family aminotransferase [Polyangiaceae bacterium]|nr:DegT/DnrJ/EryC1/StrS family aminotransferase [Polyangiaceae bacterium]
MKGASLLARFGGAPALTRKEALQGFGRWPELTSEDTAALVAVLQSAEEPYGFLHSEVLALQQAYAEFVGAPHCLAVSSGTAALHLAIAAVGAEAGDEIITPALGYIASAACALHHNCIPVFADVDPQTFNLDPKLVEEAITPRTRALIAVDLLGLPAAYDELEAIAQRHGIAIVSDASHSQGAQYRGRRCGSLGDVAAMSVMPTKNLAGSGEGGLIATRSDAVMARVLGHASMGMNLWGQDREQIERVSYQLGFNYRPTPTSAAVLKSQLARLPHYHEARQERARVITECISRIRFLRAPSVPRGSTHAWQMYRVVVVPEALGLPPEWARHLRDAVVFLLRAEGGPVGFWEDQVLPAMPVFQNRVGYGRGYPWACSAGPMPDYDPAGFPVAAHVIDASFMAPLTRATHTLDFVKRHTKPYEKLAEHGELIAQLTADIAEAGGFETWSGTSIRNERALRNKVLEWA